MRDGIRQQVWSVYVLFSPSRRRTYVGCAHDVKGRLAQHNAAQVRATCLGVPWTVLLTETVGSYEQALQRERYYKSGAGRRRLKSIFEARDSRG